VAQPLERFWPYADMPEQPGADETASLTPAEREALFGSHDPFSIALVFPRFDGPDFAVAVARARDANRYETYTAGGREWHRATFFAGDRPVRIRDLWQVLSPVPGVDVLVDGQAVPYARELWLPLVFLLI
jgi:hypothetical protein